MAKRQQTQRQTKIHKTQHRKLRIAQHEPYKTRLLNIKFKTMNSSITRRILLTKNNEWHTHTGE